MTKSGSNILKTLVLWHNFYSWFEKATQNFTNRCLFLSSYNALFRYAQIGYSAIGAVIMSFIIVYDTQIMIGGKHKYSISPEEYIFAALNLYVDIIRLFLYILAIVGKSNND